MARLIKARRVSHTLRHARFKSTSSTSIDSRISNLGRTIEDEYATIRNDYKTPQNPLILAHGLMGFDQLRLAGKYLPAIQYWRGITDALRAKGVTVITTHVPASAALEERAECLAKDIGERVEALRSGGEGGMRVNIIAHSMGGLDSRYMISRLKPSNVEVLSLTTIATPHRGSAFADYVLRQIGDDTLPRVYKAMEAMGIQTGAFRQLTRHYMQEEFNPKTQDREGVRYFSYGATAHPSPWSLFRQSHRIIEAEEGPNDGLVSVDSSKWGAYKGTLVGVSHLDLINWTNRWRWMIWEMTGNKRNFNAIAFYLDIADMLAKEGL